MGKIRIKEIRTKKVPVILKFHTKTGEVIKFKATKIVRIPNKIHFKKRKKKYYND